MRIISGTIKGKKLFEPKNILTRPLKDIAKESIFNVINHSKSLNFELKGSKVLDLFSGVGSFGLECLSRGSSSVTFIENYKEALDVLKKNISRCKFGNESNIINIDIKRKCNVMLQYETQINPIFGSSKNLYNLLLNNSYEKILQFKD